MGILDLILNPVFGPLLKLPPLWSILVISFIVSLIIVLVYRLLTNQAEMKTLKEELKKYQQKIRELKNDPQKAMELQKEAMAVNMKYMAKSMKPTIITFIPILIIFSWMQANLAYGPLLPDQPFTVDVLAAKGVTGTVHAEVPEGLAIIDGADKEFVDGKASFTLQGKTGEYEAGFTTSNQSVEASILITEQQAYAPVLQSFKDKPIQKILLGNKPIKVVWKLNWFWSYILFSIIFSIILRKLLKVY